MRPLRLPYAPARNAVSRPYADQEDGPASLTESGGTCSTFSIWLWRSAPLPCSARWSPGFGGSDMAELVLWGAGALVIGGYMLAALLRPDRF